MTAWQIQRQCNGWQLQRSGEGLARLVDPAGNGSAPGSYGRILADFSKHTKTACGDQTHSAVFVHGLMGEREDFTGLHTGLGRAAWEATFFRYQSHAKRFDHHVRALRHLIVRKMAISKRLCIIGHSFGCRLIAAACDGISGAPINIVLIAPPVSPVKWAQRGVALPPVNAFLGASVRELALHPLKTKGLSGHRVLVIEGRSNASGDGWLRSSETHLSIAHTRHEVKASHSDLLSSAVTKAAVSDFLAAD